MMTTDERLEIEEWMTMIEKSIQRLNREFTNFKKSVEKMRLTANVEIGKEEK